ncbi:MAG TPA: cytochrome P450 [Candidatus Binatia bacterium]|nr:cytochrome P450 [Candidatus Binatia bacterium]
MEAAVSLATLDVPADPSPSSAPELPPGPTAPALVQLLRSGFRPVAFLEDCARRYGDPFTVRLPGTPPLVFFSDPDAIKDIFTGDPETHRAGEANVDLAPMLGQHSLLMLDGARHLRERRLMLPAFHGERMQLYARVMREITARAIATWPVGRPFPIHREMQAITLDVILRTVFGFDDGAELVRLRARLLALIAYVTGPLGVVLFVPWLQADLGPLSPGGRFVRHARGVDELLYAAIARRRAEGTAGRDDILSMLIDARYDDGTAMDDQALRDEMVTLLLAGHETTATSLAWAFHHVLARPDVLEKLRAELARVVGDEPVEARHIAALEYLDAVIKETARMKPVVPNVGRRLQVPTRIGGHLLPAGSVASPCIYLTHHRPDVWPDPERFLPERFLGTRPSPYAFFPFGGGVRRCLGAAFATYEMKIVLAEVLSRAALRPAPGSDVHVVRRTVTFAPSAGMPVVLDSR